MVHLRREILFLGPVPEGESIVGKYLGISSCLLPIFLWASWPVSKMTELEWNLLQIFCRVALLSVSLR
jgi:hypothetical protein